MLQKLKIETKNIKNSAPTQSYVVMGETNNVLYNKQQWNSICEKQ